jgi:hypothetical protein
MLSYRREYTRTIWVLTVSDFTTTITCPIIRACVERGIDVTITKDGYKIDGFYKSGEVTLTTNGDGYYARDRYDKITDIRDFDDLVYLNAHWWDKSKDRLDGWKNPAEPWATEMVRLGLITKHVDTVVSYS